QLEVVPVGQVDGLRVEDDHDARGRGRLRLGLLRLEQQEAPTRGAEQQHGGEHDDDQLLLAHFAAPYLPAAAEGSSALVSAGRLDSTTISTRRLSVTARGSLAGYSGLVSAKPAAK